MSFHPNPTQTIIVDDADRPNPLPAGRDPLRYADGRRATTPQRARLPFSVGLVLALGCFGVLAFLCWQLAGWVRDLYTFDTFFSSFVLACLYFVMLVATLSAGACMVFLAMGLFGSMAKRGLFELPGGLSVHSFDALSGYRRAGVNRLADATLDRHFAVQDTLAQQSQYRNVSNYAPSVNYSYSSKPEGRAGDRGDGMGALLMPPGDVPPFESLVTAGLIGPGPDGRAQPLIFGYDERGEALTGDWKSLYSAGLGGLQGSGKTWTATYLLAQSALNGAKLIICDPHAGDSESLASRVQALAPSFVCDIADDEKSIAEALRYAADVLKRRKAGDSDRTPLIVAIDEWTALRRGDLATLLPTFVEDFSTEGRKLNCHELLLAQRWDKASVGGFRNTLASAYVHRLRADEARMLTGLRAELLPKDTLQLPPGVAYMLNTYGQITRLAIPRMSMAAMHQVGERLATSKGASKPTSASRPMGFQNARSEVGTEVGTGEALPPASRLGKTLSPQAARVAALLRQKKSQNEIIRAVWGVTGGGRAYQEAMDAYRIILAELATLVEL